MKQRKKRNTGLREFWNIHPATKIVPNKKEYNRKDNKKIKDGD